jgi:FtsP/CotA-like multicopper oxidase with cupredoxin domain
MDQTIHWANPLNLEMTDPARLETNYRGVQPVVTHCHGCEVPSAVDGGPDQWYTNNGIRGPGYHTDVAGDVALGDRATFTYPNGQEPATLWYHDHTLGITRINVYAGLAGYYFLRDKFDNGALFPSLDSLGLPAGAYEFEFVIQDRMVDFFGELLFPHGLPFFIPQPPHLFWNPEFLGDVIVVNGKSWPYADVEGRRYRLRLLNGSNARFYNLKLTKSATGKGKAITMWVIGTDGGLLDAPEPVKALLIAPGERYDVIIDFADAPNSTLTMTNNAKAPYPFGGGVDPKTNGKIAQFVVGNAVADGSYDPSMDGPLRDLTADTPPPIVRLASADGTPAVPVDRYRQLTLNEVLGAFGPIEALLNNTKWNGREEGDPNGIPISGNVLTLNGGTVLDPDTGLAVKNYLTELPQEGSTEVWEIINLTGDAHPIHLHLVQFQVLNRQKYNVGRYTKAYNKSFPGGPAAPPQGVYLPGFGPPNAYDVANTDGAIGGNPAVGPFLAKSVITPEPHERGWKDTVIALPNQVTRIVVRWKRQDGTDFNSGVAAFDPKSGPGYVWHCHIIDHEDNEMMRPYHVIDSDDNGANSEVINYPAP